MIQQVRWSRLEPLLTRPIEGLKTFHAVAAALELGGLAAWCLRPEVLRLATEDDAIPQDCRERWDQAGALPASHGACCIAFARPPDWNWPLVRESFVLPLQWVKDQSHQTFLPRKLIDLADNVLRDLRVPETWGLQWPLSLKYLDAREIPMACESGWASLAAGLQVASLGGRSDPRVWASGSWDWQDGIRPVSHLDRKLQIAGEYNVRQFFVPDSQVDEARMLVAGRGKRAFGSALGWRCGARSSGRLPSCERNGIGWDFRWRMLNSAVASADRYSPDSNMIRKVTQPCSPCNATRRRWG